MRTPQGWSIRLTPEERQLFHDVAQARGVPLSQLVRQLVAQAAAAEGIPVPGTFPAT